MIQLIVGLGNPGPQYAETRHNAGAVFVECIAREHNVELSVEKKFFGDYARVTIAGQCIHLLNPTTFMNRSGQAVLALANFYKIPPTDILIAYDELDLPPGVVRLRQGGGGSHNGIRDIIARLSGQKNFYRLRIGIGHPGSAEMVVNYVLNRAPKSEREKTQVAMDQALFLLPEIIQGHWEKAMNRLHSFKAE